MMRAIRSSVLLLSSLSLQDNVGKHTKKEPIEVEFIYREHIEEE